VKKNAREILMTIAAGACFLLLSACTEIRGQDALQKTLDGMSRPIRNRSS
jgi:hypothetical protein